MKTKKTSLAARIDEQAMEALLNQGVSGPVDALNLVNFADERSYRWYGLLLAPVMLALGARPVWVAVHQQVLLGDKRADEIVIVRYPSHRTVLRIITTPYYAAVNRLRERGVRRLEFSLTTRHYGTGAIERRGAHLVAHFNPRADTGDSAFDSVRSILESDTARLVYASREAMPMDIFLRLEPSDPNPTKYKETAIFSLADVQSVIDRCDVGTRRALEGVTNGISLQVYRGLSNWEAMPWARPTASP